MTDKCPVCNGNNEDMPCAYPGENREGCLKPVWTQEMLDKVDASAKQLLKKMRPLPEAED